jgi:sigma-B regulation protein RsbU (phosphoserine phosphatase)
MVWAADIAADTDFPRASAATQCGLHAAVAFPIRDELEFLGVLEFFSRDLQQPDTEVLEMMNSIGSHIGQFITRRRTEECLLQQEHERRVGQDIQQSLLPKTMPQLAGVEIEGRSFAPHEVGGDCFDFIPMPGAGRDCLSLFLADASGHGIGSALLIVQTCAYLRGVATTVSDVALLLSLTNQCLGHDLSSHHFVTAVLAMFDPQTQSLTYASAGHLPGYVLDSQGRIRLILRSTGLPLGIDRSETFPAFTVPLQPGDLVLLVTDGITEAASADYVLFGMDRTLELVRLHQQEAAADILTALFAEVSQYSNEKCKDDMTAIILKVAELA